MAKSERTTISISKEKQLELKQKAIEISYKTGEAITWTDLVHYMIENYQNEVKQDLIEKTQK